MYSFSLGAYPNQYLPFHFPKNSHLLQYFIHHKYNLLYCLQHQHDCPLQHYWEHNSTKCCNQNRRVTMGMNELDLMQ